MFTRPRSDETGQSARARMRELLRKPEVAWWTVALVVAAAALWLWSLCAAVLGGTHAAVSTLTASVAAYAAFTGMHESAHYSLGRARWLSVFVGELCATILMVRFQAFRQIHLRHHRFTNDPDKDPDRWTGIGPRWQLPLRWATTDLNYYREYDAQALRIPLWQDAISWCSLVALIAAVAALLLSGHGWALLWSWLVPARVALFLAAFVADYLPHLRPHAPSRRTHRYAHTVVIRGRYVGLLSLGHNLHLVHHLYPAVPFYRCHRIWRLQRDTLLARGAREVSMFDWATIWRPERPRGANADADANGTERQRSPAVVTGRQTGS